jgi:putative Ig domain-containing protein
MGIRCTAALALCIATTGAFVGGAPIASALGLPSRLAKGTAGEPYSDALASVGGTPPYHFAIASGSLPAGLELSESGVLAGTPTEAGEYKLRLTDTDSSTPAVTTTRKYTLKVALELTPVSLPPGEVGVPYGPEGEGVQLEAFGGLAPYTFEAFFANPSEARGLTLGEEGRIYGTPEEPGVLRLEELVSSTGPRAAVGSHHYVIRIKGSRAALAPGEWLLEYSFSQELEPIYFDSIFSQAGGKLFDENGAPGTWSYDNGAFSFTLEVAPGVVNEYVGRGIAPVGPFVGTWHNGEWAFRMIRE